MTRIINPDLSYKSLKEIHETCASIVLAGGCFDIVHIGHLRFLKQAKQLGKTLVILLESDQTVKRLKGETRPYFTQQERAEMLSEFRAVDVVVCLPPMVSDDDYIRIVDAIKPEIIAVTEGDRTLQKKQQQADRIHATLAIISLIQTYSTSSLAQLLGVE